MVQQDIWVVVVAAAVVAQGPLRDVSLERAVKAEAEAEVAAVVPMKHLSVIYKYMGEAE